MCKGIKVHSDLCKVLLQEASRFSGDIAPGYGLKTVLASWAGWEYARAWLKVRIGIFGWMGVCKGVKFRADLCKVFLREASQLRVGVCKGMASSLYWRRRLGENVQGYLSPRGFV